MQLKIESSNGVILELDHDHMAILPITEYERALAFTELTRALALLARIRPLSLSYATGVGADEYSSSAEQCRPLAHTSDNIVAVLSVSGAR